MELRRAGQWCAAVVMLSALGCAGPKGDKGDPGEAGIQGPLGPTGPAGTFSGTFTGPATFSGPTDLNGTTLFGGQDLFTAAMQGTHPAVLSQALGGGSYFCGAPTSFSVASDASPSAAYGSIVYTKGGIFGQNPTSVVTTCANLCWGPLTFFLRNPGAPKAIAINVYLDDGPGYIYVDGNSGPNAFRSAGTAGTQDAFVNIPTGPFAISFIACSVNGASVAFTINENFVVNEGLEVNYDRTFHRNGM